MIDYKLDIVYLVEANTNWIHPKGKKSNCKYRSKLLEEK